MSSNAAVAVIPEEYYRKSKGVQFRKSFRNREDAVSYAQQRGYRLVIVSEAEGCYDVMCRREQASGPKISFELVVDRGELVAVPRSLNSANEKAHRQITEEAAPRMARTSAFLRRVADSCRIAPRTRIAPAVSPLARFGASPLQTRSTSLVAELKNQYFSHAPKR